MEAQPAQELRLVSLIISSRVMETPFEFGTGDHAESALYPRCRTPVKRPQAQPAVALYNKLHTLGACITMF